MKVEKCGRAFGVSLAMDTPERNQIGTPISRFEDSPVFNYINNLSPIQPVKSIHVTQTFNSLSFASLPSVFTSPHVNFHKESRFLRRHQFSDPSKPEFSSDNGNKASQNEEVMDASLHTDTATELKENFDPTDSVEEASVEPSVEHTKIPIDLPRTMKYDSGSPDGNQTSCGFNTDCVSKFVDPSTSLVLFDQEGYKKDSVEGEVHFDQRKEAAECDWEGLISDASDLLVFDSPEAFSGVVQKSQDLRENLCSLMSQSSQDDVNDMPKTHLVCLVGSSEQPETEDPSTQPGEASELKLIDHTQGNLACTSPNNCLGSNESDKMDNEMDTSEFISNLHRGMRRRCLIFEKAGNHSKKLDNCSNFYSSMLSKSDEKSASNDKQMVPIKPGFDSSRCILPGIGLHLNALAASKDYKVGKHEPLVLRRQQREPSSTFAHSPTTDQEPVLLINTSSEKDTDPILNGVQLPEDGSNASEHLAIEESSQGSPKKKRRKLEQLGEIEACKRCNCKKSKCLKLYCECFAAGVYCIEPCSCLDCFNKPLHEDTVLATRKQIESRNPLAFAPKVIRNSDSLPEIGDESSKTPASARHKRGCNCKKSSCLKKYCECYQGGVGCSINCRCEGCKNAFGRKDGSLIIETEAEAEEESETNEKSAMDKKMLKPLIQNPEEQNPASVLPATPLRFSRVSVQLPFSSKNKPPRSSFLTIGSSCGQRLGKPNFVQPQPKQFQNDELPEVLRDNGSPNSGVKNASPNSKRVSPPHCDYGLSPGRRSSRKLILQSIPTFPNLNQS